MFKSLMRGLLLVFFMGLFVVPASGPALAVDPHKVLVQQLTGQTKYLDHKVMDKALTAFHNAQAVGVSSSPIFTVIDYSKPSYQPRLWVFDLKRKKLLYEELVSHGRGSGETYARKFSNVPESWQSSLGLFITEEPYYGQNGYSLRLNGLEENVNHLAKERAIVIHGDHYVTPEYIRSFGRLGLSHGCPVVDPKINRKLINTIKEGSLVFVYYPEKKWLRQSAFLQK